MSKAINVSSSQLLKTGIGKLKGIVINSHSSGVIKIYDALSAGGLVMFNTITLSVGERFIDLGNVSFDNGIYFQLVSGTADITFLVD